MSGASKMDSVLSLLRNAESVVIFTGAGMSQESGIPTFRDALEGIWENFSPEDLATPEAFERDPQRVRDFYEYRPGPLWSALRKNRRRSSDCLPATDGRGNENFGLVQTHQGLPRREARYGVPWE